MQCGGDTFRGGIGSGVPRSSGTQIPSGVVCCRHASGGHFVVQMVGGKQIGGYAPPKLSDLGHDPPRMVDRTMPTGGGGGEPGNFHYENGTPQSPKKERLVHVNNISIENLEEILSNVR